LRARRLIESGVALALGSLAAAQNPAGVATAQIPAGVAAGQGPIAAVDSCVRRLDSQVDVGYDRIAARCPELARRLEESPLSAWLPSGWKEAGNDLSAGGLKELRALAAREAGVHATTRPADIRYLKGILAEFARTEAGQRGWWERFKAWLHRVLESRGPSSEGSWLVRSVAQVGVSESIIELVSYGALALVVVLAGAIIANELRHAGLFAAMTRKLQGRRALPEARRVGLRWEQVELAPLRERPRMLLGAIAARLSELGRLPPSGAMTTRELARAARLAEPDDRSRLSELALMAERACFSDCEMHVSAMERPLARGRELLDRLNASPHVAASARS